MDSRRAGRTSFGLGMWAGEENMASTLSLEHDEDLRQYQRAFDFLQAAALGPANRRICWQRWPAAPSSHPEGGAR